MFYNNVPLIFSVCQSVSLYTHSSFPTGDAVSLALQLYEKYRSVFTVNTLRDFEKQFNDTVHMMNRKENIGEHVDEEMNEMRWFKDEFKSKMSDSRKEVVEDIRRREEEEKIRKQKEEEVRNLEDRP